MTITTSSRLLINENPLQVLPSLAASLKNINEAIILQQVQYWLSRSTLEYEGRRWIYNTFDEWRAQFPWMSKTAVRDRFKSLETKGILLVGHFNKMKFDRTKWYSIDYDKLNSLIDENVGMTDMQESCTSNRKKVAHGNASNLHLEEQESCTSHVQESCSSDVQESCTPIPETTRDYQKTNTENRDSFADANESDSISKPKKLTQVQLLEQEFEKLWKLYPKKIGKQEALKNYKTWRKKSKTHTYAAMYKNLENYLKYLRLNKTTLQYTLAGYKWFGGRFEDELDISTPTYTHNQNQKYIKSSKVMTDWKKKQEQQATGNNTSTMSDEEMNQIFNGL